ncbi:hypothetical protein M0805_009833 [Coniferiporia weirii]|nr:hypothetical protein M0805_009833 [Coniferiporia weirii]
MAGANYMGGRRNAARARTKDVAGRVQKGHFSKQRHQILAQGLHSGPRDETRDQSTRPGPGRVEEITFAHAKNDICGKRNGPARATYAPRTLSSSLYSSFSPNKINRRKRSKILDALDINEPIALRATMNRLLRLPDFAGLAQRISQDNSEAYSTFPSSKLSSTEAHLSHALSGTVKQQSELINLSNQSSSNATSDDPSARLSSDSLYYGNTGSERSGSYPDYLSNVPEADTDYQNSCFSELEFVDELECEEVYPDTTVSGGGINRFDAHSGSPLSGYSPSQGTNYARKLTSDDPVLTNPTSLSLSTGRIPREKTSPESLHPVRSPALQVQQVSLLDFPDPWRALDDIMGLPASVNYRSDGHDPLEGVNANDRSGVGYKPLEADPLPDLPASNDSSEVPVVKEDISLMNTPEENKYSPPKNTYDQLKDLATDSGQLGSSDMNFSSPLRQMYSPSQAYATPPRRFKSSLAPSTRVAARPRFSLNVYDSVSSILSSNSSDVTYTPSKDISKRTIRPSFLTSTNSRLTVTSPPPVGPRQTSLIRTQHIVSPNYTSAKSPTIGCDSPVSSTQEQSVSSTVYQMLFPDAPITHSGSSPRKCASSLARIVLEGKADQVPAELSTIDGPDLFGEEDEDED